MFFYFGSRLINFWRIRVIMKEEMMIIGYIGGDVVIGLIVGYDFVMKFCGKIKKKDVKKLVVFGNKF